MAGIPRVPSFARTRRTSVYPSSSGIEMSLMSTSAGSSVMAFRASMTEAARRFGAGVRFLPEQGQLDHEGGALVVTRTLRANASAVELHEVADDGQAEAQATMGAGARTVGLAEA